MKQEVKRLKMGILIEHVRDVLSLLTLPFLTNEKLHCTLHFLSLNLSLCSLQITDFGLARFYCSTTRVSDKCNGAKGGTHCYMPPEAFSLSYKPTKASDIYRWHSAGRLAEVLVKYSQLWKADWNCALNIVSPFSYGILLWSTITGNKPYESEWLSSFVIVLFVCVRPLKKGNKVE